MTYLFLIQNQVMKETGATFSDNQVSSHNDLL